MSTGITHIIGAGLAGLSAATLLAARGARVVVHEAAGQAGGRCRSYHDDAFGGILDNGNHLLLSGNDAALAYLKRIGSQNTFAGPREPSFAFADATNGKRWTLRMNNGRLPLWLLDGKRRVPDTHPGDYFSILSLLGAGAEDKVPQRLDCRTELYRLLWEPLLVSALNTEPKISSARLAGAVVRGTLFKGGKACIPLVSESLSATFIDPALRYLATRGARVVLGDRLRQIRREGDRITHLDFANGESAMLATADSVILAIPAWNINGLLPDIKAPDETRAILNAHFRITPPEGFPRILGVIGATAQWVFCFADRISVTVSDADALMQEDREVLARRLWQEISALTGLAATLPLWQIVKEKRATFAATPKQDAMRPGTVTAWRNVFLAGDWVQTGLPATIEGAVRSGERAAEKVLA